VYGVVQGHHENNKVNRKKNCHRETFLVKKNYVPHSGQNLTVYRPNHFIQSRLNGCLTV
jgi:hypothetical protein